MQQEQDYKVTYVEARNTYPTAYGDMQAYALKLEGVDGFVQLGQKPETPAPEVGGILHGYTYEQKSAKGSFLKFKKVNSQYSGGGSTPQQTPQATQSSEETEYMITLLEAIADKLGVEGLETSSKKDTTPESDEDDDKPIDLSEIPF